MPFSFQAVDHAVAQATHPEELRDIIVNIFDEMRLRLTGVTGAPPMLGFDEARTEDLMTALFRTVNEMLVRWGQLQTQLGNTVVSAQYILGHSIPKHLSFRTSHKVPLRGKPSFSQFLSLSSKILYSVCYEPRATKMCVRAIVLYLFVCYNA